MGGGTILPRDILPARSLPRPGELLSSWLVRLAMAHGLKLHTFCTLLFGNRSIWNRDIDKCADDRILTILAQRTGTPLERARMTTLASYEGALYERHNALGNTAWIMPLGIYHRVRRMHGIQYCPACLAEDKEPYFRCEWRLAFVTVCTSHRRLLFDACPRCDAAINFHRDELGVRSKQVATGMARCFKCKFDLRRISGLAPRDICCDSIDYQSKLSRAVTDRWIDLGSNQIVYAVLYFPVLRQLMKLLATCRGSRLLIALCRETGVPPFPPYFATGKADIDSLRIAERHQLKALAAYLLEDWGERFVKICLAGRVWSSTLLRDFESAPFWYWNIIRAHLYRASHHATTAEITAAIAHINLSGGVAYQKAISDLLGVQNVFRKRKTLANFSRSTVGRAIVKVAKVK